jgi:hypothetical protein
MGENLDIGLEWTDWMVGLKLHKAVERLSRERKAVELKCSVSVYLLPPISV